MMGNGFGGGGMWLFAVLTVAGLTLLVIVAVRVFGAGVSRPASTRDAPAPHRRATAPGRFSTNAMPAVS